MARLADTQDRIGAVIGAFTPNSHPHGQVRTMKIDMSKPEPVIDARDLARYLDLAPQDVMDLMRQGAITSLFETGVDEHAGTYRLTFTYAGTKVRFTSDVDGNVLSTARFSKVAKT